MNSNIAAILLPYQELVEKNLRLYLDQLQAPLRLKEACQHALLNGGKRFRPVLTHLIASALNPSLDVSFAALAIEFFHTASLIADDLPCMDDEELRRSSPALHKAFGEDLALLASYALISEGYECIVKNGQSLKDVLPDSDQICLLAIENVSINTGVKGATGGQYLDIYPEETSLDKVEELICKKTVSLFEISFVFGWLFGGGSMSLLPQIKKAAYHFGMAFQIADDLEDLEADLRTGRKANFAIAYSKSEAQKRLDQETVLFLECLHRLKLNTPQIVALTGFFKAPAKTLSEAEKIALNQI